MSKFCFCGNESKYCCPKCELRTCSLSCVKKHKLQSGCDGIVEKTKFVKLSDFDNLKLISDFKFLENIKEFLDNSHRQLLSESSRNTWMIKKRCMENNTLFKFMPDLFSRSKANKSYFNDNAIFWSLDLIFADSSTKILAQSVSESSSVAELLDRYKHISANYAEYRFVSGYFKDDPEVSYFVQAERFGSNIFHKIDPNASIKDMLAYKTVIEYPTVYVTKRPSEFQVIECQPFNVEEEMKKLGIFPEKKRKRNARRARGSWKKKRGMNREQNNDDRTKSSAVKTKDSDHSSDNINIVKTNSFRDQCLQLFDQPQEVEDGEVSD